MDDGLPSSGNVATTYDNKLAAANSVHTGVDAAGCFDPVTMIYNMAVNNGAGVVGALSFRFQ
jgi:hypothetical protein